jgi:hypothetical protein
MKLMSDLIMEANSAGLEFVGPYTKMRNKTVYKCPVHGDFFIRPCNVKLGVGCKLCFADRNRLPPNETNRRASSVGLVQLGDHKTMTTVNQFRCEYHGIINLKLSSISNGVGCPKCVSEPTNNDIENSKKYANAINLEFIGPYIGATKYTTYRCASHGLISKKPSEVKRGKRCKECVVDSRKMVMADIVDHATRLNLVYVGGYVNASSRANYKCSVHGDIFCIPWNVKSGHGCQSCASSGFFKNKPAVLYVIIATSEHHSFVGYGITGDFYSRIKIHQKNLNLNNFKLILIDLHYFEIGQVAFDLESAIKLKFKSIRKPNKFHKPINWQ